MFPRKRNKMRDFLAKRRSICSPSIYNSLYINAFKKFVKSVFKKHRKSAM